MCVAVEVDIVSVTSNELLLSTMLGTVLDVIPEYVESGLSAKTLGSDDISVVDNTPDTASLQGLDASLNALIAPADGLLASIIKSPGELLSGVLLIVAVLSTIIT